MSDVPIQPPIGEPVLAPANPQSDGTQVPGSDRLPLVVAAHSSPVIGELVPVTPLSGALQGIASSRPDLVGGPAQAILLEAAVHMIDDELRAAREQARTEREHADHLQQQLTEEAVKRAGLQADLKAARNTSRREQFMIALGVLLAGSSVPAFEHSQIAVGVLMVGVGLAIAAVQIRWK